MGFILTHPTPNSKEATKIVKNVSTKKQENKKSFTFVGVGDNLYHGAMYWYPYQRDGYYNFDSYYEMTNKPVFRGLHHECLEAILRKS